jgi:hypothetical protein
MINEGISYLPQAIVTDQIKQGLKKIFDECPYAIPLSESHDSFFSEVPIEKKEEYAASFERNIEVPINFKNCSLSRDFELIIPTEIEWSAEAWTEMTKLEVV